MIPEPVTWASNGYGDPLRHDPTLARVNASAARQLCDPATIADNDKLLAQSKSDSQNSAAGISVEVADSARLAEIQSDWLDLVGRADVPNVFMNPTLVRLAAESYPGTRFLALLAWQDIGGLSRLAGIWAFAVGRARPSIVPIAVLVAPPMAHAYLATPVIDRDCLFGTFEAMLETVASDSSLPNFIALDAMGMDGATMQALARVLAGRGSAASTMSQAQRPKLASALDGKQYMEKALSSSSRKKLRQYRRRLGEKGVLETRTITEPEAVRRAFDDFLQLEDSGWKGRQHTALLSSDEDATFARAMVAALASRGDAYIHALYLDGRPASMQIVLRAGQAAFTWKTAYDESLHDVSPGVLLLEDYTAAFLADKSIAFVDSCAYDDSGYMAAWSERQQIANLWIDARRDGSFTFAVLTRMQRAFLSMRTEAKHVYLACRRRFGHLLRRMQRC